ncbi:NAD(P)H-binding protein [Runella sp. SP2]|uniref:NAD(P)H-binding protein n=1 Tax=Runella sp. SP2 TaxID=2268026 RepID=UPI000F094348|nr:NAD(P)H-binding protein [Runella sp. SP2]AYQ31848.1 NAD-dependent dehydratase [Runella sp. SP2]
MKNIFAFLFCALFVCAQTTDSKNSTLQRESSQTATKKVLVIGASGNIASIVIDILAKREDIELTLFLRDIGRLKNSREAVKNCKLIESDVFNYEELKAAIKGQDIVYGNLSGDLGPMAKNIVKAMEETQVNRLIFICSVGIYDTPLKPVLAPYRQAADIIEGSKLDYTILRPTWFIDTDEVDYELTQKGQAEKGSVVSKKSVATFITKIIENPQLYIRQSIGINKPKS